MIPIKWKIEAVNRIVFWSVIALIIALMSAGQSGVLTHLTRKNCDQTGWYIRNTIRLYDGMDDGKPRSSWRAKHVTVLENQQVVAEFCTEAEGLLYEPFGLVSPAGSRSGYEWSTYMTNVMKYMTTDAILDANDEILFQRERVRGKEEQLKNCPPPQPATLPAATP